MDRAIDPALIEEAHHFKDILLAAIAKGIRYKDDLSGVVLESPEPRVSTIFGYPRVFMVAKNGVHSSHFSEVEA